MFFLVILKLIFNKLILGLLIFGLVLLVVNECLMEILFFKVLSKYVKLSGWWMDVMSGWYCLYIVF